MTVVRQERTPMLMSPETSQVESLTGIIGVHELTAYKFAWRAAYRFRRRRSQRMADRRSRINALNIDFGIDRESDPQMSSRSPTTRTPLDSTSKRAPTGFPNRESSHFKPTPVTIAARLMLAQLLDRNPTLHEALITAAPTVIIDVPNRDWIEVVGSTWREVFFDPTARLLDAACDDPHEDRDVIHLVKYAPPSPKHRPDDQRVALMALALAVPFVGISPLAVTHLPDVMLRAATWHLELPSLDPSTILRCIRIITGKKCLEQIDPIFAGKVRASDLIIAVRVDRTPHQCIKDLQRLVSQRESAPRSRNLALVDLYGLEEARAWAEATIMDLAAWKLGNITWDALSSRIALNGPPGTGKTLFAKCFATECGLPLVTASYSKWQSSGDGHLGHLLRAMYTDFDAARSRAPSVLFIDELDSFPDRTAITNSHRDYTIKVVNGLLEQVDGLAGLEGVILIGASNDLSRCDPALLRAGRFDKIARIGIPRPDELEKMFRVRLGDALREKNISALVELAIGFTGADIELVVKEAKRTARQAGRPIELKDLHDTLSPKDTRSPEMLWRASVHEASHILVDVIHFGPHDIFATTTLRSDRGGASIRTGRARGAGTHADYRKRLEILLAGRAGEELLLGAPSDGAGGTAGSDLDVATRLAADMVSSLGLIGSSALTYLGPTGSTQEFLTHSENRRAIAGELSVASKTCRVLLTKHHEALEAVARQLLDVGRIEGFEVAHHLGASPTKARHAQTRRVLSRAFRRLAWLSAFPR